MQYHDGKLCISTRELFDSGIVTRSNYSNWTNRNRVEVASRGGGAVGSYALVVVESLPTPYLEKVREKFGTGEEVLLAGWVRDNYIRDAKAVTWFNDRNKHHVEIKDPKKLAAWVEECVVNASVLNCIIRLHDRATMLSKLAGESYQWEKMGAALESLREQFGHTLPTSMFRLRKKVAQYRKEGYLSLISGKFGNQNTRRMSRREERVILSIACLENQPYNTNVREMYIMFLAGELDVWDYDTGELYDPETFAKKDEEPWIPSEATIVNYLNKPSNKAFIQKRHRTSTDFYHEQMPHMHRHNGEYSLAQITMDDVDLPRRMKGNNQVHAYYAYDVVSQCRLGLAYGRKKDDRLVVECFRDMFRLLEKHGWGTPAGLQVEQHLMSKYKDGFLRVGGVFSFVQFCAPLNHQDKYAEPLNGAFKRTIAHKNHAGVGRWYGKGKNRVDYTKISDEDNETYEAKRYYTFEELVADDRRDSYEWNHTLHPNQKKYPGLTRWQVLEQNIFPDLVKLDKVSLSYYIGEKVPTTIRRNSTVRVACEDWRLSKPAILEKLEPNNYKVDAYYLPDEDGNPTEVYIFQGSLLIDKVERIVTFNRVMAEQTEADKAAFTEQCKMQQEWEKYFEDNAPTRVGVAKRVPQPEPEPYVESVEVPSVPEEDPDEIECSRFAGTNWGQIAVQDQ